MEKKKIKKKTLLRNNNKDYPITCSFEKDPPKNLTKFALGLDSRLSLQRGADSMFVLGADTEIIVDGFIQLSGLVGQLIRWNACHFGPGGASGLTALKHILGEWGSTIIFGWFP